MNRLNMHPHDETVEIVLDFYKHLMQLTHPEELMLKAFLQLDGTRSRLRHKVYGGTSTQSGICFDLPYLSAGK